MNKIEKLRKIINETYCQACNDFGLCEYCEPKQTLVDIETVFKYFKKLIENPMIAETVYDGIVAYKRLMDSEEIKVRTTSQISKENLLKYEELKIWSIIKKYPEELGMILQCKDYEEYKSTFSDIDCEEEIEITEEQFNLVKNFFTKKEPIAATPNLIVDNMPIDNYEAKGLLGEIKCPYCNESYFSIDYTTSTLMYCPTIIKDGKVVSHDGNTTTEVCTCHNCHKKFFISHKDGKTTITGEE